MGVPIIAGRDFNALDGQNKEDPVAIVSETLARRMFPNQDAINRHVYWTDPVLQFFPGTDLEKSRLTAPHRIIGVTADIDDGHVVPEPTQTVYSPFNEFPIFGGRFFIHTGANPYALVAPVTRVIHDLSVDQPVEHPASLEDIRAEVLTPDRLNSLVFGVFAAVALAIAVVGVAGVLAFSVSSRTREFGIRLALGSAPKLLLKGVIAEGTMMAAEGRSCGRGIGMDADAFGGKIFPGRQDAGRFACVCLWVRADGGRGYRVGAARGTCCARGCNGSVALRVTIERFKQTDCHFRNSDEMQSATPACFHKSFPQTSPGRDGRIQSPARECREGKQRETKSPLGDATTNLTVRLNSNLKPMFLANCGMSFSRDPGGRGT